MALDSSGTVNLTSSGTINMYDGAAINNARGGVFIITASGGYGGRQINPGDTSTMAFNNAGNLEITGSGGVGVGSYGSYAVALNNSGTLSIAAGVYLNLMSGVYTQTASGDLLIGVDETKAASSGYYGFGPTFGQAGYGQLVVANAPSLAGALTINTVNPVPYTTSLKIIVNNSYSTPTPPSGIFTGMPQGSSFTQEDYSYQITYIGGSNSADVVLTQIPTIQIGGVSEVVNPLTQVTYEFPVTLTAIPDMPQVTVNYATSDNTATVAAGDYNATSGTLTFVPGTTTQDVAVTVNGASTYEPAENFYVTLSSLSPAGQISQGVATGTITSPLLPNAILSIASTSGIEPTSGTGELPFTVTLAGPSDYPITVNYSTQNGTAIAGTNYQTTSGSLTFLPGVTSETVDVPILAAGALANPLTFSIVLSSPANATIGNATATGTILNASDAPTLTILNTTDSGSLGYIAGRALPGTPSDPIVSVTVNGTAVQLMDAAGDFFDDVNLNPGTNNFTVTATDSIGATASQTVTLLGTATGSGINFANLTNVTADFTDVYGQTSLNQSSNTLFAGLTAQNTSTDTLATALLVEVTDLYDANGGTTVQLLNADGTAPDGTPYYNLSGSSASWALAPGQSTSPITLEFSDPKDIKFTYQLKFLSPVYGPPGFTSIPVAHADAGSAYTYNPSAFDPAPNQTLTYSIVTAPAGMSINAATGVLTWTDPVVGNQAIALKVTDSRGESAVQNYTLTVSGNAPIDPPAFTSSPLTVATVGSAYTYQATARDADGDQLQFALVNGPSGMTINASTGLVSWTPTGSQGGVQNVNISVTDTDDAGQIGATQAQSYQIAVQGQSGNLTPQIVSTPVTGALVGQAYSYQLAAIDADGDTLTWSLPTPGDPTMSINATTGLLTWADPSQNAVGPHTVTVRVDDGYGNFDTQTYTLTVADQAGSISGTVYNDLTGGGNINDTSNSGVAAPPINPVAVAPTSGGYYAGGIEYYAPNNTMLLGTSSYSGSASQLWQIGPSGSEAPFTRNLTGLSNEIYMTSVPNGNLAGFTPGDVFLGNGQTGQIVEISGGGSVLNPWITIKGADSSFRGGFAMDTTGVFGGNLIALTTNGQVWEVHSDGTYKLLASANASISEGVTVIPNAPAKYGPLAGTIAFTNEDNNTLYTVNSAGTITGYGLNTIPGPEGVRVIGPNENFFGNTTGANVVGIPAAELAPYVGDLLVGGEFGPNLYALSWVANSSGGYLKTQQLPVASGAYLPPGWEGFTLAPAGVGKVATTQEPPLPAPVTVYLDLNHDGRPVPNDPAASTTTDANGNYTFSDLAPGNYTVRELLPAGYQETQPTTGSWNVSVPSGDNISAINFGNQVTTLPHQPPEITSYPPTITIVGQKFEYDAIGFSPQMYPLTWSLNNAPAGMVIDPTTGMIAWTPQASDLGVHPISLTVNDGQGDTATQSFNLDVVPNFQGIAFESQPPLTVGVNQAYSYTAQAIDPAGGVVSYSLSSADTALGLAINPSTGVLTWTPATAGIYGVTVEASDNLGNRGTQSFALTVNPNPPPTITSNPTTYQATVGTAYTYNPTASDAKLGTGTFAWSVDAAAAKAGVAINASTGALTWTPTAAVVQAITVTVSDENGSASQSFKVYATVAGATAQPPEITSTPTSSVVGTPYQYIFTATDPQGQALTLSANWNTSEFPTGNQPAFDPATGLFAWNNPVAGNYQLSFTATDSLGLGAVQTFTLPVIAATTTQPPTITSTPGNQVVVGQPYKYQVVANDPYLNNPTFSYSLVSSGTGPTISAQGLVTWTPAATGSQTMTVTATDADGSVSQVFTVAAVSAVPPPQPPQFTSTPTGPAIAGKEYQYLAAAIDPQGSALTWSADLTAFPSADAPTFNAATGALTWADPIAGNYTLSITATDAAGLATTQTYTLPVMVAPVDQPPQFTTTPQEESGINQPYSYQVSATDTNGDPITFTLDPKYAQSGMTLTPDSATPNTATLTWTPTVTGTFEIGIIAADSRGDQSEQTYNLVIVSTQPPTITSLPPAVATVGTQYSYNATASDSNLGSGVFTWSLDSASLANGVAISSDGIVTWTPSAAGFQPITVTVTDQNGYASQTFTVQAVNSSAPAQPPQITSQPAGPAIAGKEYQYVLTAIDPQGSAITWSASLTGFPTGNAPVFNAATHTLKWADPVLGNYQISITATDAANLSQTQTFTLPVTEAPLPPIITSTPPNLPAAAGSNYQYQVLATDPQGDAITYSLTSGITAGGPSINASTGLLTWSNSVAGSYPLTITATDSQGASSTQQYTLTVNTLASVAPSITGVSVPPDAAPDQPYTAQVTATSPLGDPLTYSISGVPGMTIDPITGLITWTPPAGTTSPQSFTLTITDPTINVATTGTYTVTVVNQAPQDNPPVFSGNVLTTAVVGQTYQNQITASSPENYPLTYSLDQSPNAMSINATTGLISWDPSAMQLGNQTVIVQATDSQGGYATEKWTINVTALSSPPVFNSLPVTAGVMGKTYYYAASASDATGGALTYSLVPSTDPNLADMSINGSTGLITWTPPTQGSAYSSNVTVEVTNSAGQTASQPFAIAVGTTATLPAPAITSQPGLSAVENQPYQYQVTAYDANLGSGSFSYTVAGPNGTTIPNASINSTGLLDWTPGAIGPQSITIIVTDANGSATQTFTVNVTAPTAAPVISPIPDLTVTAGNLLSYNDNTSFLASGDSIASWSFANPSQVAGGTAIPVGLTITDVNDIGQIRWQTSASTPIGSYTVGAVVTDIYGQSSQSNFTITVAADTAPTVQIAAITPTVNGAANTYDQNTSVTIAVTATDAVGVTGMTLTLDGNPVTLTTVNPGYATAIINTGAAGTALNLVATATNAAGLTSQPATLSLTSINPTVTTAPALAITETGTTATSITPVLNDDPTQPNFNPVQITAPTMIYGNISDGNTSAYPISWTLSYAPVTASGTGSFTTLATGTASTAQTNAALGTFDPTLLQNGQYVIQLTATNTGGLSSSTQIYVAVLGQEKIGNFQFSQTDVTIPVAGLPIELTRNYNSLDRNTYSDLGYGWTLGTNFNIQEDQSSYTYLPVDTNLSGGSSGGYVPIRTGGDRNVWITLPNGQRTEFLFTGELSSGQGPYNTGFVAADPTNHYTLSINFNGAPSGINRNALGVQYWNAWNGGAGLTQNNVFAGGPDLVAAYEIPGYILTAPDGTKFYFQKTPLAADSQELFLSTNGNGSSGTYNSSGSYTAIPADQLYNNNLSLTKIVDANGNQIGITSTGYSYTSPITGQTVQELAFVRDIQGRIIEVQNVNNPQNPVTLVTYTYDSNGDLTQSSVLQTPAVTDSNGNITTPAVWDVTNYTYLQGTQAHIIQKITSPSGSTPIINQYDAAGRLISSTDSNGKTITYNPNIAGNQEVVTDRNGNQTVYVYDNQGRVVDQTDPQGHETQYVYGDSWTNNPTTVTTDTLVNGVATNVLTKAYTYDQNGNQLSETYTIPAAGNDPAETVSTYSTYTTINNRQLLLTSTDANGTVTTNSYDPATGNLIETVVLSPVSGILAPVSKTTFGNYNLQGLAGTITQYNDINAAGQLTPGIFTPYSITQMYYDSTGDVTETDVYSADPVTGAPVTLLRKTTFTYDSSGNQTYSITWNTSQPTYPAGVTPPALPAGTPTSVTVNGITWYPYAVTQNIYDAQNRLIESIDPEGNTTKTLYNADGQVSQTIDARGLITQNNYDLQGQLASTISDLGTSEQTVTSSTYDANGNVITSTDAFGNVTKSLYDSNNNLVQTLYPDGTSTETFYNAQGLPQYTTDRHVIGQAANGTETIYDAAGRVIGTDRVSGLIITVSTNAAGVAFATLTNPGTVYSTTSQTLNAAGQVLSSTGTDGQTTTFTYNALGQQVGSTLPNGGTTSTVYDALGRKVSQTDPNGLKTSYVYDAAGDLIQTIYADGTSTSATYDGVGNKLTSTDQMNQITTYSYNVAGQILTVTEPAVINPATGTLVNPVTTYSYDQFGDEISSTSPNGNVAGGNPAAYTTTYAYDQFGNQVSKTLPPPDSQLPSPVSVTTYDGYGRTLTTTNADGQVTLYVYDSASAALPELNADGSATTNTYNDSLVPVAEQTNLGRLYAKFYFDTVNDYNNYVAGIGQSPPTNTANPNETIIYAYYTAADVQNGVTGAFAGSVKSITDNLITPAPGDPRSPYTNVTTFQYDSNNNVVQESGPSGTINYVYNQATQRHTETWTGTDYANAVSDIVYGYNNMGELASVTVLKENGQTPTAVASSTIYDALGGTSTTNLPNTVYTYDAGGRLETTLDSATGITTKYTYKPDTNYVSTETVSDPSVSSVNSVAIYSYTYRADGSKTGETDQTLNSDGTTYDTRTLTWQYDGLDRLTQETSVDSTNSALNYTDNYTYDLNSNRIGETEDQGNTGSTTDTITSTYNADDELTKAVDANTGTTVYGYDSNGSQTGITHTPNGTTTPDSTTTNEYDLQGQLAGSQVTTSSGTATTTYFYDDSGNRIEEVTVAAGSTTPVTTYYLVDTNNPTGYSQPIEQSSTPGTPQITYIWGAQLISETYATGATIPGVGTASSPTTYYLLQDAHGSTRLVADANGNIVARYNYDDFGDALGFNAATALTTYLYSSMPYDAASGNYYDHARFYDAGTGGFTQADYGYSGSLANPMTDLPYMYGGGDPINMSDWSGHEFSLPSISVAMNIDETLEADEDGVANEALTSGIKAKEFNFDLGFQLGAGSGGWGPHAFLYVPSRLSGTGLKYDVTGSGDLYVHEEPLAQVLGKTWFGKLFQIAEFSLPQYIEWTSSAWLINAGARGPDLLLDPGVLFTDMHFSYSFLPGTVNCFKWTLLAGVSGWIISKT